MRIKLRAERLTAPVLNEKRYQVEIVSGASQSNSFAIAAIPADPSMQPIWLSAPFGTAPEAAAAWKNGFSVEENGDPATQAIVTALLDRGLAKRVLSRN